MTKNSKNQTSASEAKSNKATDAKSEIKKITRIVAATRVLLALKVATSRQDIIALCDKKYADHGGKANPKEALYGYRVASEVLRELGQISSATEQVMVAPVQTAKK